MTYSRLLSLHFLGPNSFCSVDFFIPFSINKTATTDCNYYHYILYVSHVAWHDIKRSEKIQELSDTDNKKMMLATHKGKNEVFLLLTSQD
jgi:hypothetical protein